MKRFIKRSIPLVTLGFIGVLTILTTWTGFDMNHTGEPKLTVTKALASEKGLKAGMIAPKTGKKVKYWAAPMDPTYIRNEPGKSPMGMELVPVFEEEGEEKAPASVIRIDPSEKAPFTLKLRIPYWSLFSPKGKTPNKS